jgi:hypothetical protein
MFNTVMTLCAREAMKENVLTKQQYNHCFIHVAGGGMSEKIEFYLNAKKNK